MKIKFFGIALFAIAMFFFACQKEDLLSTTSSTEALSSTASIENRDGDEPNGPRRRGCMRGDTVDISELPGAAVDFVNDLDSVTIQLVVKKGDRGFAVQLSNGVVLLFNADGEFISRCGMRPFGPRPPRDTTHMGGPHRDTTIVGPPRDSTHTGPRGPRGPHGPRGPRNPRGGGN